MRRPFVVAVIPLLLSQAALSDAASPESVVLAGEDCVKLAHRVYGDGAAGLALLKKSNPGVCDAPLTVGAKLKTPPLPKGKPAAAETPRLSFVGPAVRTKTKTG